MLGLAATVFMFVKIPKGFIPDQDTDQIYAVTEAAQGTSYYQMVEYQKAIADVIRGNKDVLALMSTVGGTSASTLGGPNYGEIVVHLKPRNERNELVNQIIDELRPKVSGFPGMRVYLQNPPTIRIGGQVTKSLYQFSMQSPDKKELYDGAQRLQEANRADAGSAGRHQRSGDPEPAGERRHRPRQGGGLQVSAEQIENAFYDAYGPRWVSTIYAAINEYKVLLELKPQYQSDPHALSLLYFKSANGQLIPLDTLAQGTSGRRTAGHQPLRPASRGDRVVQSEARRCARRRGVEDSSHLANETLPDTISTNFQGAAKAFQTSLGNLWVLLIVAILVVYIVLGILYESYIHPITILSGLPSAGFGALMTLYLFHMDLNIYAFVGLIMLIGIVEKNAIMQIDFALEAERNQGLTPLKAIYEGCLIRFRPIMMTTMAAMLGAVPIALGYGAGGEARQPLGLVVVGGLLFSQTGNALSDAGGLHLHGGGAWKNSTARQKKAVKEPIPEPTIA